MLKTFSAIFLDNMQEIHQHTYHLTAGECDATGHMPMPLVVERFIEVATEHANMLGVGYSRLIKRGIGWVLSRIALEMKAYPRINDTYTIATWVESINSHFSLRNMVIYDSEHNAVGYGRTVWTAIDYTKRTMADLNGLRDTPMPVAQLHCPVSAPAKVPRLTHADLEYDYKFRFCDLDFNRHVNTIRYLELILNRWPLQWYEQHRIGRLDVAFNHECYFDETVMLRVMNTPEASLCEIVREGERCIGCKLTWIPRI